MNGPKPRVSTLWCLVPPLFKISFFFQGISITSCITYSAPPWRGRVNFPAFPFPGNTSENLEHALSFNIRLTGSFLFIFSWIMKLICSVLTGFSILNLGSGIKSIYFAVQSRKDNCLAL